MKESGQRGEREGNSEGENENGLTLSGTEAINREVLFTETSCFYWMPLCLTQRCKVQSTVNQKHDDWIQAMASYDVYIFKCAEE